MGADREDADIIFIGASNLTAFVTSLKLFEEVIESLCAKTHTLTDVALPPNAGRIIVLLEGAQGEAVNGVGSSDRLKLRAC